MVEAIAPLELQAGLRVAADAIFQIAQVLKEPT